MVIVICLIFDICDLEFLVTQADCHKRVKMIKAPSGGSLKPGPLGPDSLLNDFIENISRINIKCLTLRANLLPSRVKLDT